MNIETHVPTLSTNISVPIKIKMNKTFNSDMTVVDTINTNCSFYEVDDVYYLKQNLFDPTKGSPPSNWSVRLVERIEKYYNK